MPPRTTVAGARKALRALADPARAASMARYFQAAPGGYGEGDRFLGLTVPQVRAVARAHRGLPLPALASLLGSRHHEDRFLALAVLVERARRAGTAERAALARFYLAHLDGVDNWDLVDLSAPALLGPTLRSGRPTATLRALARSRSVWRRRVALLATLHAIRGGEHGPALALAEALLHDPHDLIHKAAGWMLREVGQRDPAALAGFLEAHAQRMPRTMLRCAVEGLPAAERSRWRAARSAPGKPLRGLRGRRAAA